MEKGASRPLEAGPEIPEPEVRKPVTVLFADLVDSTRMSRQLDPEALRHLLLSYFEQMQAVIERHGGLVEKFIGDAVMAVFGVPVVREDDALRAVRAAVEMRETLATLNQDLEQTWGVRLSTRVGINSGEVVAGQHQHGQLMVTGAVVNLAKRLEEAAATSEILISDATHRLVRDAVVAERVSDRVVKHGETVDALRVAEVLALAPGRARRLDSPLVGREHQLSALRSVFASARQNRACHLLTVLGPAGIGKSRLVQEFVGEIGAEATVLNGHCLPYGEGITYWPLTEVVREILSTQTAPDAESSSTAIAELLPGEEKAELIAELILEALGLGSTGAGTGEATSWAVRKLFEAIAQRRPLVVVFDDLQWAEPTFVDLVDYLAELSRDAPILLVCMARPELLDNYPDWAGGKLNATSLLLEPLNDGDCRRLIANLLGRGQLPAEAETQIAEAADGNALFAEELLAMLIDDELLAWDGVRWVAVGRLPGDAGAADDQHAARRTPRGPAQGRARAPRAGIRRGHAVPSQRDLRARSRGAGRLPRAQSRRARPPRRDPARPSELRRRRGLPLPPPPDSRCRVQLALEGQAGRLITSAWRPGSSAWPPTASASTRRSSATTSSRRTAVASSSARAAPRRGSSAHGPRNGSSWPGGGRSRAATCRRRSACSSARRPRRRRQSRRAELLPELGAALIEAGRLSEADGCSKRRGWSLPQAGTSVPSRACSSSCSSCACCTSPRAEPRRPRARSSA